MQSDCSRHVAFSDCQREIEMSYLARFRNWIFSPEAKAAWPSMVWPGWLDSYPQKCLFSPAFSGWRFTPLRWTCYILLADAAVLAMRGHSRLHDAPWQFAGVALLSIPLWLVFEAY